MRRSWCLSTQRDEGYTVRLEEYPAWLDTAERLLLCMHCVDRVPGLGRLLWSIPVGRPKRDEDGWLENSVMNALTDAENWALNRLCDRSREVARIPVTVDQARAVDADFVSIFEGDE